MPDRPRRPRWRRIAALGALALLLAGAGLGILAPQLPVLAREGFPAPLWPAHGDFAIVAGVATPDDPPPGPPPPAAALARFQNSAGRALLLDHGGVLMAEAYGPGLDREDRLNSYSLVKGLVGALVVRAVADGRLQDLDQRLPAILGPQAPDVTLRELLQMTSGLALSQRPEKPMDDAGFSPIGPLARLHAFGIRAILPRLRIDPALRGQFHYQSVNTALLGLVAEQAYGRPLPELLSQMIWRPAGAADAMWRRYPAGDDGVSAYCCLYARPLDWLKAGRFLLDNGTPEAPFLPRDLWRDLFAPDLPPAQRRAGQYGLHIRHDVLDRPGQSLQGPFSYFLGHDGQLVYFLPGADSVAVRFGDGAQLLHSTLYELLPR